MQVGLFLYPTSFICALGYVTSTKIKIAYYER